MKYAMRPNRSFLNIMYIIYRVTYFYRPNMSRGIDTGRFGYGYACRCTLLLRRTWGQVPSAITCNHADAFQTSKLLTAEYWTVPAEIRQLGMRRLLVALLMKRVHTKIASPNSLAGSSESHTTSRGDQC